jgi:hypothetical protein
MMIFQAPNGEGDGTEEPDIRNLERCPAPSLPELKCIGFCELVELSKLT